MPADRHAGRKIKARRRGEIRVLELIGALTYPDATAALAQRMNRFLAAGERLFVLHMLGVPWLDSSGMGEVVACGRKARRDGRTPLAASSLGNRRICVKREKRGNPALDTKMFF